MKGFTFLAVQKTWTDFEFLAVCFLAVRLAPILGIFDSLMEGILETNGLGLISELMIEVWWWSLKKGLSVF